MNLKEFFRQLINYPRFWYKFKCFLLALAGSPLFFPQAWGIQTQQPAIIV
ncbi:hypothetical protein AAH450_05040 [Erwinia sp. P7711]